MNFRQPLRCLVWRRFLFLMNMIFLNYIQCWKCIRADMMPFLNMMIQKIFNGFFGNGIHRLHCDKSGAFILAFNGYQDRLPPAAPRPRFPGLFSPMSSSSISIRFFDSGSHYRGGPLPYEVFSTYYEPSARRLLFVLKASLQKYLFYAESLDEWPEPFHRRKIR